MTPYVYRGFHDVPRMITLVAPNGQRIMLSSYFDAMRDDFDAELTVLVLPVDTDTMC